MNVVDKDVEVAEDEVCGPDGMMTIRNMSGKSALVW